MNIDEYQTINTPSEGIYKEKGSRFLSFAFNVNTIDDINSILAKMQKKYHDARHICYAWKLGLSEDHFRQNDDGEPSGTAGRPIYGQILSFNVTNILIVVVRYFGGIKLGTGGLIVAYKTAAADALENSQIIIKQLRDKYKLSFKYEAMNAVMKIVKDNNVDISSQSYELVCSCVVTIRRSETSNVISKLSDIDSVETEYINNY